MKRPRKAKPADAARKIDGLLGGGSQAAPIPAAALRHFTADEHVAWCQTNLYRDEKGRGWQPLRYTPWQKKAIRELLALRADGALRYKAIMPCFPRRCGKSEVTGAYDVHRCLAYDDQKVVIQANSADQGEATVFGEIAKTLENSPRMKELLDRGEIEIKQSDAVILFHRTGSQIKVQPAAERSTYGQKIHVYHNTELCRAVDDACYQTGASSTGDAWCGLAIVDSNLGDASNAVKRMMDLAEAARAEELKALAEGRPADPSIGDPAIGAVWIRFADLQEVLRRGCGEGLAAGEEPIHPWLDADWVRSRYANMTRGEFLRNHCNQPSGAGEVLWTEEQVAPLFLPLPMILTRREAEPLRKALAESPSALLKAASAGDLANLAIGVGLDRASAFAKDPDRSVLVVAGRLLVPALVGLPAPVFDGQGREVGREVQDGSIYLVLAAWEFMYALKDPIQAKLLQIDRQWGIGQACLEAYQASDLAEWCAGQRFGERVELRHMTAQAKQQLVQFAHGLIVTRRLVAPAGYVVLRAEMMNYREDAGGGGALSSFGGRRQTVDLDFPELGLLMASGRPVRRRTWIKDDYWEATLWALEAARGARVRGRARLVAKPQGW
jgi:hypothetical protein